MDASWDRQAQDVPAIIDDIVRSAVAHGYLRGLEDASVNPPAPRPASKLLAREEHAIRLARAQEVAEEFVRKVYVEQLTSGND